MNDSTKSEDDSKTPEAEGQDAALEAGSEAVADDTAAHDSPDEAVRPSPFGDVEGLGADGEVLPEPEAASPAETKPRRGRKLIIALVVLLAVFVAGLVAWPLAAPRLSAYLPAGLVFGSVMAEQVDSLESRVQALESQIGQSDPAVAQLQAGAAATTEALAAIETRITALESIDPTAQLSGIAGRLESLESAPPKLQRDEQLTANVEDLAARLQALESGLARQGDTGPQAGAAVAAALERIAAVERAWNESQDQNERLASRLAAMEESTAQQARDLAAQADKIAGLEEKTAAQSVAQSAAMSGDARGAALVLAVGQLRAALKSSAPFQRDLATLEPMAADAGEDVQTALDVLRPLAVTGVPTVTILQARYEDTASAVVRATIAEGDDWMSRTMARLSSLVTIRRTGEVAGSEPGAIVARAEQRLGEGDLAAAVAELEALSGAPAEAAADWLADARRRLAAEGASEDLNAAAVASLGR